MIDPYRNYYVALNGMGQTYAVRCPRLDKIQGEFVKISLKQFSIYYTNSNTLEVIMGRLYLEGVGNTSMFCNDGKFKNALMLFADKTAGSGNDNVVVYRAGSSDELAIIVPKDMVSGMDLYITNDLIGQNAIPGNLVVRKFDAVLEITEACAEKCAEY